MERMMPPRAPRAKRSRVIILSFRPVGLTFAPLIYRGNELKPAIEKDNELQTSNAAKPPTASQFTILVITVAAVYSFGAARYRACASRTAGDVTIAALSA